MKFYKEFILGIIERINEKFHHFVTFVIRKENLMSFWCITQDCMWFYFLLLGIWKASVEKHINHMQDIKMTTTSLFWSQKWQNDENFNLIRSIVPSINSLWNCTMFFTLNWDKLSFSFYIYQFNLNWNWNWDKIGQNCVHLLDAMLRNSLESRFRRSRFRM